MSDAPPKEVQMTTTDVSSSFDATDLALFATLAEQESKVTRSDSTRGDALVFVEAAHTNNVLQFIENSTNLQIRSSTNTSFDVCGTWHDVRLLRERTGVRSVQFAAHPISVNNEDAEESDSSSDDNSSGLDTEDFENEQIRFKRHCGLLSKPDWVGHCEMRGTRLSMEDCAVIVPKFGGQDDVSVLAVFDGHGGAEAAEKAAEHLEAILSASFGDDATSKNEPTKEMFQQAAEKTLAALHDRILKKRHGWVTQAGSTALIAMLTKQKIFIANLGDSRAVLFHSYDKATVVTKDHAASDPQEKAEVEKRGGFVARGRVQGNLLVSRALGDSNIAEYLSRVPDVYEYARDCAKYLLLSCDGVWEKMTADEVVELIDAAKSAKETDMDKLAEKIAMEALRKGSTDNVTVLIAKL